MKFQESKEYLTFRKERYTRMFIVQSKNLAKNSKYELSNPLKKLLGTSGYQLDKTEALSAVAVDFMSMIHKTGFEKHPKIKNGLKRVWNSILAQSNAERIEIV